MAMKIDEILHGNRRRLRNQPEKILMDANGLRLWADYMEAAPGFTGRFDFIHKINIPSLFSVECSGIERYEPAEIRWEPSNVEMYFQREGISLKENKFITLEDAAVSCMMWENKGENPFTVRLSPGTLDGTFDTTYGRKLAVRFFCNGEEIWGEQQKKMELEEKNQYFWIWEVSPQSRLELCVAAQICLEGEEERMRSGCEKIMNNYRDVRNALVNQKNAYQEWFDRAPEFTSSDPLIDKTWAYRWYILRHNMMKPEIGNLKEIYFCEGRSHKMTKEPYHPDGWEFSKLIPLSVPMHLLDLRWYGEKEYGTSILHVMRDNQDENGEFRCAKVDWHGNPYANFFGWAVWQYYLVSGKRAFAAEALPVVKKQVQAWKKCYGNEKDTLLTQYVHQLTGMEYQPSYWYFHDYPKDCRDEKAFTPVKRVDRNVYHYLNALAVSMLCEVCGDTEGESYRRLAEQIRGDILEKMWDQETGYFYDLHYRTDEKAFVKNIVGVFPFFGGIAGDDHKKCMETLMTDEFDTPCPFPSVSTKCPVFTGEGGWQGQFFKGRNGCIWNGPAWPFSNSIVLDGMGRESQRCGHIWDEAFKKYFMKFTSMHYYGGDGVLPYLVEHYNSLTGECISDDVDYSHSYYIDLVVRYIAGVSVEENQITLDPVDIGLKHFSLKHLVIRGHCVDICLGREGILSAIVDGAVKAQRRGLGKLVFAI